MFSNEFPLLSPYEQLLLGSDYTIVYYDTGLSCYVSHKTSKTGVYLITGHCFSDNPFTKLFTGTVEKEGKFKGADKSGWTYTVYWGNK